VTVTGWMELPPFDYRLVAVVRNARSGYGGEFSTELSVAPAPAAATGAGASP